MERCSWKKGDLKVAACPSREFLSHVTSRWGALVMLMLMDGTHRFGELRQRIGSVSEKMLAQTLQTLEEDGFVARKAYPEVPPRVEYALTPLGQEIAAHVEALGASIEDNLGKIMAAREARMASQKARSRVTKSK